LTNFARYLLFFSEISKFEKKIPFFFLSFSLLLFFSLFSSPSSCFLLTSGFSHANSSHLTECSFLPSLTNRAAGSQPSAPASSSSPHGVPPSYPTPSPSSSSSLSEHSHGRAWSSNSGHDCPPMESLTQAHFSSWDDQNECT
jgi:hypothetical protein